MGELVYRPDIYEGKDPYIYISCHQDDRQRIMGALEKLDLRGIRFWLDDGIAPGMETDEILAEHIENCDFFVAFLSQKYLDSLDTLDELNYSRDTDKEYMLVYLEDVQLPAGIDMRFMRAQSLKAGEPTDDSIYSGIMNIENIRRFYGIADERLGSQAERIFEKLEKLYPDHRVFALDAIDHNLAGQISELYVKAGYPGTERLMLDYGFTCIGTMEARKLRSSVLYQPGFEPDTVKPRIDYILEELRKNYPSGYVNDLLAKSHKAIYRSLQGISLWLGYDSMADMLNAYGFTGVTSDSGRTEIDYQAVIDELKKRYDGKPHPRKYTELINQNKDMQGNLKTLANKAPYLFGRTFTGYLVSEGILVPREKEEGPSVRERNREIVLEEIRKLYESGNVVTGSISEAEETLKQLIVKKSSKGIISVVGCGSCEDILRIPYGIDRIASEAFVGQTTIREIYIPASVKEIDDGAFSECSDVEKLVFEEGLERIGNSAFSDCTSLKEISLPATLKSIGNEAFSGCEELAAVTLKNARTNIQQDAFDGCIVSIDDLQNTDASPAEFFELKTDKKNNAKITAYTGNEEVVVVPEAIAGHPILSIEKGCFKENDTVREIYISDRIASINGDAFKDCKKLEKVHISEAVSTLTSSAFAGCTALSEVNIPDAMTDVQRGLFKDAPLTTLFIGKGVQHISPDAFYKGEMDFASGSYLKQKTLEHIFVDAANPYFISAGSMLLSADGRTLYMEMGDPVSVVIPDGVEEIAPLAFDRLGSVCEVKLPDTLKVIGEKAFAGTNIKTVEFPKSLESIGNQAFSFCRKLSTADLNEGLISIGQQAFEGCPVQDVFIPKTVIELGSDSFLAISTYQGQIEQHFRVDSANEKIIADGIALYIKDGEELKLTKAYSYDLRLKPDGSGPEPADYEAADGTTEIGPNAFAKCNNLASIKLPDSVTAIGDMAFWDCTKLNEIHIPEGCEISPKAFFGIQVSMV